MTTETKKVEETTKTSLMKNKKEQLINIILRKDAVERDLRTEIKSNKETINEHIKEITKLKHYNKQLKLSQDKQIEHFKTEYEDTIDNYTEQIFKLRKENNKISVVNFVLMLIIIIGFVIYFV